MTNIKSIKSTLDTIHNKVLHSFTYCTDKEQYNTEEKWVMPNPQVKFTGDCEDFALACRAECRKLGIPSRLVFCATGQEGHAVLECEGWILDNNQTSVKAWQDVKYTWISISGYEAGDEWHDITSNNPSKP